MSSPTFLPIQDFFLAILVPFLHIKFKIILLISRKNFPGILIGIVLNKSSWYLNNIESFQSTEQIHLSTYLDLLKISLLIFCSLQHRDSEYIPLDFHMSASIFYTILSGIPGSV